MTEEQKKELDGAFQTITEALKAAMAHRYPIGWDAIDVNLQVRYALQVISAALKAHVEHKPCPDCQKDS